MKVISKQYNSKSDASNKIVDDVSRFLLPHLEYLIKFLRKSGISVFTYKYDKLLMTNGDNTRNLNEIDKYTYNRYIRITINQDDFTIKFGSENDFFKFENFKELVTEKYGDSERIAFCQALTKYVEFLQEEIYEIEKIHNTIDIIKKSQFKREIITEKKS